MKHHLVDILVVLYSTFHDILFLGVYVAWEKIFGRKRLDKAIKKSVEERLGQLEALHRRELDGTGTPQTVSSTGPVTH